MVAGQTPFLGGELPLPDELLHPRNIVMNEPRSLSNGDISLGWGMPRLGKFLEPLQKSGEVGRVNHPPSLAPRLSYVGMGSVVQLSMTETESIMLLAISSAVGSDYAPLLHANLRVIGIDSPLYGPLRRRQYSLLDVMAKRRPRYPQPLCGLTERHRPGRAHRKPHTQMDSQTAQTHLALGQSRDTTRHVELR